MTDVIEFSGSAVRFAASGRAREIFDGRDATGVGAALGGAFWYHDFTNPATGQLTRSDSLVKLPMVQGVPLLVGSGHYRPGVQSYRLLGAGDARFPVTLENRSVRGFALVARSIASNEAAFRPWAMRSLVGRLIREVRFPVT